MQEINLNDCLNTALEAAIQADQVIMDIYQSNYEVEFKEDESPITIADQRAHQAIAERLQPLGIRIISEEGIVEPPEDQLKPRLARNDDLREKSERRSAVYVDEVHEYSEGAFDKADHFYCKSGSYFWLVDPLDGTKEFINKNGEFTVNIALIQNNRPILGVVSAPALNTQYYAVKDQGAFKLEGGGAKQIHCSSVTDIKQATLAVSRSHLKPEDEAFIEKNDITNTKPLGSALKYCQIAEGSVDLSVRYSPLMEWDIAASDIIMHEAGSRLMDLQGNEFSYLGSSEVLKQGVFAGFKTLYNELFFK